ncbi:MAG: hypothetical protein QOI38_633 [Sphingomonadales bacterium]|jgi:beta-xylosidase|nr:hypothetical protein [Sphingomonadales bacterium]
MGPGNRTREEMKLRRPIRRLKAAAAALATLVAASASAQQPFPPALPTDFADPFVLPYAGRYYAFATNILEGRVNVPVAFSTDLSHWELAADPSTGSGYRDALPRLPAWSRAGATWAPEVIRIGDRFLLYFTAPNRRSNQQCIGVAVSRDPRGPYEPQGDGPIVCQTDLGGTIDASPFRDADGQLYLYYKNDGNHPSARTATQLWGQRLSPDGLSVVGEPVSLGRNDAGWERHVIEAPFMLRRPNGSYLLFYSAGDFAWQERERLSTYATGYAVCTTALGPCADAPANPFLASRSSPDCLSGPGHPMVFQAEGQDYLVFHGWATRGGCRRAGNARFMHIARLDWRGDAPQVGAAVGQARR